MTARDKNDRHHLEGRLDEWGESPTPPVDGAFANRLEASLRQEMINEPAGSAGWSALLFRPSVIVVGLAVVIIGFALAARSSDDVGLADGVESTIPIPPTTMDERTTTTSTPDGSLVVPPITTDELPSTTTDQTTIPRSTAPQTTDAAPTTTGDATTIQPVSIIDLTVERDGRQVVASWTLRREVDSIVGWVLIASIGGDGDLIASSRDPATRTLTGRLANIDQTLRVEGRDSRGVAIVSSEEVPVSPGG